MTRTLIFAFIILISFTSHAKIHHNKLNTCTPSPETLNDYEPAVFNSTNNLLRKTGMEAVYCGQKILLDLEIVDKNCVPISDAKIYVWQVGCDGKYPYEPLRKRINKHLIDPNSGSSFCGSGIATTNNLGIAKFLTVYPPAMHKESPHINIRIEHKDYGSFQTKLHLNKNSIIEKDEQDVVETRIVTSWENNYRRY